MNTQKVCFVDAYALGSLSKRALHAFIKMITTRPNFTLAEMQTLTGNSASVNYGILHEWETAHLVDHTRPAPGRASTYAIQTLDSFSSSVSTTNCLSVFNKIDNDSDAKALPNACEKTITRLAETYGLPPEFLEAKCQEKEQRTGRPRDYAYVEKVLQYAKQHAQRSFEGLFYKLYVEMPYFVPSASALPLFATQRQPVTPPAVAVQKLASQIPECGETAAPLDWQAYIEQRVDYTYFKTWVLPCTAEKSGETVTVYAPSDVHVDHLNELYLPLLAEAFHTSPDAVIILAKTPDVPKMQPTPARQHASHPDVAFQQTPGLTPAQAAIQAQAQRAFVQEQRRGQHGRVHGYWRHCEGVIDCYQKTAKAPKTA